MKLSLFLLSSLVASVNAFAPRPVPVKTTTALSYTIIGPPDEDVEQDPHSVGYNSQSMQRQQQHQQQAQNGAVMDLSFYRDIDEFQAAGEDDFLNVDAFSHAAGSSIMAGHQLTALCGDD